MSLISQHFFPRRPTRTIDIGNVRLGGSQPICIQSMLTSSTLDVELCVAEACTLAKAGAQMIRLTARSKKEASHLQKIQQGLRNRGYTQPLIADIHFSPEAALIAAKIVAKVRINPGNFIDRKRFEKRTYSDKEYQAELKRIEECFTPLIKTAHKYNCALRIGCNHGSLSDRILNRFGDTPLGMAESALEYIRVAEEQAFQNIVVSMKASNVKIMLSAYRVFVEKMQEEQLNIPLHLGVTEAGLGYSARIKSAIGIGSLLLDGIGDTIRVSLTEDSVHEIPVAKAIISATVNTRLNANKHIKNPFDQNHQQLHQNLLDQWKRHNNEEHSFRHEKSLFDKAKTTPIEVILAMRYMPFTKLHSTLTEHKQSGADAFLFPLADCMRLQHDLLKQDQTVQNKFVHDFVIIGYLESNHIDDDTDSWWQDALLSLVTLQNRLLYGLAVASEIRIQKNTTATNDQEHEHLHATIWQQVNTFIAKKHLEIDWLWFIAQTHPQQWHTFLQKNPQWFCKQLKDLGVLHQKTSPIEATNKTSLHFSWQIINSSAQKTALDFKSCDVQQSTAIKVLSYRLLISLAHKYSLQRPNIILVDSILSDNITNLSYQEYATTISCGSLLIDGIGDAISIYCHDSLNLKSTPRSNLSQQQLEFMLEILQASRLRFSHTEYIACPSCGRTMFSLQETTKSIQNVTRHLSNVKIAVMGCIVNGPGEMADADFGYVGAGPGRIHLYHKHKIIKANILEKDAPQELITLIKAHNLWVEPSTSSVKSQKQS